MVALCASVGAGFGLAACGGDSSGDAAPSIDGATDTFNAFWSDGFAGDGDAACQRLLPDLRQSLLDVSPAFGITSTDDCAELVEAWASALREESGGETPPADLEGLEILQPTGEVPEFLDEDFEQFANGEAVIGDLEPTAMQLVLVGGEWLIATPPGPFPQA